uniref:Uncharacterized protein n=1 Tax=Chromera velia CCMP2878 TaxID=1169474 RepID=A0A0K6S734_9ALVE|eukprot:Cvel_18692.t2-p1 / transcript=Cvel_18692.t2 / gene=Cvel_18692 / organism=Chromera_velia_CCMP2878 / gene_product=Ankyrin repeat domain-containing protein 50, putative / transcript_product=Ankyrin repeat domain-containing protein 50, putative / location=Cvel_scaffold1565:20666-32142(+) / protein_length=1053 / sequence_SO=supercontig / SO=protein_coding / is_pseudo=false
MDTSSPDPASGPLETEGTVARDDGGNLKAESSTVSAPVPDSESLSTLCVKKGTMPWREREGKGKGGGKGSLAAVSEFPKDQSFLSAILRLPQGPTRVLRSFQAISATHLRKAVETFVVEGHDEDLLLVLHLGADLDGDVGGVRALHWVVWKNHLPCLKRLVEFGVNLEALCDTALIEGSKKTFPHNRPSPSLSQPNRFSFASPHQPVGDSSSKTGGGALAATAGEEKEQKEKPKSGFLFGNGKGDVGGARSGGGGLFGTGVRLAAPPRGNRGAGVTHSSGAVPPFFSASFLTAAKDTQGDGKLLAKPRLTLGGEKEGLREMQYHEQEVEDQRQKKILERWQAANATFAANGGGGTASGGGGGGGGGFSFGNGGGSADDGGNGGGFTFGSSGSGGNKFTFGKRGGGDGSEGGGGAGGSSSSASSSSSSSSSSGSNGGPQERPGSFLFRAAMKTGVVPFGNGKANPSQGETALAFASFLGFTEIVEFLLEKLQLDGEAPKGTSLDESNTTAASLARPLSRASTRGHWRIVKMLIEKGADPNGQAPRQGARPLTGRGDMPTPLWSASTGGHTETVRALLDGGASVDLWTWRMGNGTPLYAASDNGHSEIVSLLLERGADVNLRKGINPTPLVAAAKMGHIDAVRILLQHGADFFGGAANTASLNPLTLAAKGGHTETVELLLAKLPSENPDVLNQTLFIAADCGHEALVTRLLDAGADIETRDTQRNMFSPTRRTPLIAAAERGYTQIVEVLLDRGAALEETDDTERTAIFAACKKGICETVGLLLDRGASVFATDRRGFSPLSASRANGKTHLVAQVFIQRGKQTEVDADSMDGEILLMAAIEGNQADVVDTLLERGVSPNACRKSQKQQFLFQPSPQTSAIITAASHGYTDIVEKLLEKGADVNVVDKRHQKTPLFIAAEKGRQQTARVLIRRGAYLEVKDKVYSASPLWIAAANGHRGIVEDLLDAGGRIDVQDGGGATALWIATVNGHKEVVKLLLEKGADRTNKKMNRTAEEVAVLKKFQDIVDLFTEHAAHTVAGSSLPTPKKDNIQPRE